MANKKVSELSFCSPFDYSELVLLVKNGASRKQTLGKLFPEIFQLACSDRSTALTVVANVASFRVPFPIQVIDVFSELNTVSSSGLVTVGIKKNGTTILTTNLSIDASGTSSLTAATPYVFSGTPTFARGDLVTIDVTAAGTGAKGLIVSILALRNGL